MAGLYPSKDSNFLHNRYVEAKKVHEQSVKMRLHNSADSVMTTQHSMDGR